MINALYYIQILKWVPPAAFMIGSAPNFFVAHLAWRTASFILPAHVYQKGDDLMYSAYQRLVLLFFENLSGIKIKLYGDIKRLKKEKENIILICNHQSTADWVVANVLAVRQGSIGHIRYVLKDGLRYLPLYGFYFRQHSGIYVQRSGKFEQDTARSHLRQIVQFNIPFWMVVFPEGTRFNDATHEKSKKFAEKNGLPVYEQVLVPRQKALQLSVEELHSVCHAVYDVTIAYSNTTHKDTGKRLEAPSLPDFLDRKADELHLLVDRVEMKDVPVEEEALKLWLLDRFAKKDRLLQDFYSSDSAIAGKLGKDAIDDKLSLLQTFPSFVIFGLVYAAVFSTHEGRSLYWKSTLGCTLFGWAWMALRK